ncbi:MAG: YbbR-like domain-containing protein [Clostridia bacterium]|jgi:YbbR domain-containing protein
MINILRRNFSLKLISFFFALVLWSLVIGETNPYRLKTIRNVPVVFTGEAALRQNNLVLKDDAELRESKVNVTVEIRQKDYKSLGEDGVEARLDLSQVREAGQKIRVKVEAVSKLGTVYSVSPSYLELDVDPLIKRQIPVTPQITGEIPEGYWNGPVQTTPEVIELTGAKTDVEKVQQALITVSLDGLKRSLENAVPLTFVGEDGEEVVGEFSSSHSSVIVNMEVYPKKKVPIDVGQDILEKGLQKGTPIVGKVVAGYEIKGVETVPSHVVIAGDRKLLEDIDHITTESVNVKDAKHDVKRIVKLSPPKGVELVDRTEVEVVVFIGEKEDQKKLVVEQIEERNVKGGSQVSRGVADVEVEIKGNASIVKEIKKESIILYLDLQGLEKGTHTVPVQADVPYGIQVISIRPSVIQVEID